MLASLLVLALSAVPKLAVLPVAAGEGVPPSTAAALSEALSGEVRRRAGVEVVTQREIAAVLSLERQRAMLGCSSDACVAELGGALGCDRLVTGDLARLGESFLLHLRLVETGRARVLAQSDRRLRGGTIDDVLDALPAMVADLFPAAPDGGGAARPGPVTAAAPVVVAAPAPPAPTPPPSVAAPPGPLAPPWAEEPADVPPAERQRLAAWSDGAGHLLVTEPFVMDAPLWWGDDHKLFRLRVRGGGQEGTVAMSRNFWEPRVRRGAEAELDVRAGQATLTCGDRTFPLRLLPLAELSRRLKRTAFLEPRWRRIPHALARDDEGTYFYVDGARGADGAATRGTPDYRLYVGRKGRLARQPLEDALDDAGLLLVTAAGRLEVKREGREGMAAAWLTATGRRPLTWLEPTEQGALIYGGLGVYAGESLGTPCDGRLPSGP
jgi:hypothetical protein